MLEKFKQFAIEAHALKFVKGGKHEPAEWYSCVDETGHNVNLPVNYGQTLEGNIDRWNSDPNKNALVGCEATAS